jgi:hypothetical protein
MCFRSNQALGMASICKMDVFPVAGIVVITEPTARQVPKFDEFRKRCSCKSLLQVVAVLIWLRPSAAGDGRRLTLAVTLSAPLGILSVQLTSDVTLLAPAGTPLTPNALTRVAGSTLSFVATVTAANSALLMLVYDRQPDNVRHNTSLQAEDRPPMLEARRFWPGCPLSLRGGQARVLSSCRSPLGCALVPGWLTPVLVGVQGTISTAGDLVSVAVSDGGNFGCERLCGDLLTLPMTAAASIAIVVAGATPDPYNPFSPSSKPAPTKPLLQVSGPGCHSCGGRPAGMLCLIGDVEWAPAGAQVPLFGC